MRDMHKWCEGVVMHLMESHPEMEVHWVKLRKMVYDLVQNTQDEKDWNDLGVYDQIKLLQKTLAKLVREKHLVSRRFSHCQLYKLNETKEV